MNAMTMPGATVSEVAVKPFFSVRDIHAYYGESYIVQGVSFEIAEGDIVAHAEIGRRGGRRRDIGHAHRVHQWVPPK